MAHRAARLHRSPAEWAARALLAVVAAVLGYGAVTHSLANAFRVSAIERAHRLAPGDGRITAYLAKSLSGPQSNSAQRVEADRTARLALRQDPTAVAAVAVLGLNAQVRGDTVSARRLFAYSDKLSRRDLRTRLWAIEDAVARDDIPGALRNYDIALRTSRSAPPLLYPVLASAIDDADIAAAVVETLAARPPWAESFVEIVARNGANPRATAQLFRDFHTANIPVSDGARAAVIERLIADKLFDEAWSHYSFLHLKADRRRARDPKFTANLTQPSPFDWKPMGGVAGVATVIRDSAKNGVFDFSAPPSVGGLLLQQMQMLPAGDYLIEGRSIGIEQPESSRPYWTLACLEGRELGRVVIPNSTYSNGKFRGRFTVPQGCQVQYLRLVGQPSNLASGLSGQIDQLALRPVG